MNERDVRLLSEAGHWSGAVVAYVQDENAWQVYLNVVDKTEQVTLTLKTGSPRLFKTSDTAIHWCHEMGFKKISVHLSQNNLISEPNEQNLLRIVLIEDNLADIELTVRAFQNLNANIDVLVYQDGTEALDFLLARGEQEPRNKKELPRLIILDLKLPKLSGHEVLKQIRENEATLNIPVVILSTSKEESDISLSYELGSNSYIHKPIAYEDFCAAIEEIGTYWLNTNTCP